jgi:hypothetical protein
MTSELERYLKDATRGLWGKKKLEVREELEAHVLEQAHKLELQGLNHTDAIQKVLEQIGPANIVSSGMIGVHTMPNVLRTTLALASISVASAMLVNTAQAFAYTILFGVPEFRNVLESANLQVKDTGADLEVKYPGSEKTIQIKTFDFPIPNENTTIRSVSFSQFMDSTARESKLPVRLQGWSPTTMQVGSIQIQFPWSEAIYSDALGTEFKRINYPGWPVHNDMNPGSCTHKIQVKDTPGMVYVLMTTTILKLSESADGPKQTFNQYDFAPVQNDGTLSFKNHALLLEFSKNIEAVVNAKRPLKEELAVLFKLTEKVNPTLEYEVVMPEQAISKVAPENCY